MSFSDSDVTLGRDIEDNINMSDHLPIWCHAPAERFEDFFDDDEEEDERRRPAKRLKL
jgi:hypothetical protein